MISFPSPWLRETGIIPLGTGCSIPADGKTLLYCPAGRTSTVTVADGTQVIDTYAFHRSQASHVALPDGLQSIRDYGFKQSALISVDFRIL